MLKVFVLLVVTYYISQKNQKRALQLVPVAGFPFYSANNEKILRFLLRLVLKIHYNNINLV